MRYITTVDGETYEVEINSESEITVSGRRLQVDFQSVAGQPGYSLILDGQSYEAYVYPSEQGLDVLLLAQLYHITVEDERQRRLRQASGMQISGWGEFHLKAPMPGLIVAAPVAEGRSGGRAPPSGSGKIAPSFLRTNSLVPSQKSGKRLNSRPAISPPPAAFLKPLALSAHSPMRNTGRFSPSMRRTACSTSCPSGASLRSRGARSRPPLSAPAGLPWVGRAGSP